MAGTIERVLSLKLVGNTKDLDKDMSKTRKGVGKLGKAVAGLAVVGIGALTVATIEGIKAFREEQDIIRSFNRTVKNLNLPVQNATRVMDRMADRAVNLGFDDAETIQGMNTFLKLTGSIGRAAEVTSLTMDIARSRQISLTEAQRIAIGVYNGSARSLRLFGIEGKKGMEAIAVARRKERGQAREWARNHPFLVTIGKVNDTWADLVGNLSQGNFKGAQEAFDKLGRVIRRALFGFTDPKTGKHVKGLVDKLGDWGRDIANGILEGISKVDWGKTLSDTLNRALGLLGEAAKNGTLTNIAVLGAALAGAIFAFRFFVMAAKAVFGLPGWGARAIVSVAAKAVGLSFSLAMFALGRFLVAAKLMFGLAGWGAKAIVRVAAVAMGKAFALAMFVASWFISQATQVIGGLKASPQVKGAARGAGRSLGRITGAGMAFGIVTAIAAGVGLGIIVNAVLDALGVPQDGTRGVRGRTQRIIDMLNENDGRSGGRFATGTAGAPRGWSWVGERGPELVRFRGGEQVRDASRSARMAGSSTVINLTIPVPPTADRAAIGKTVMDAIDAALARGHRFRSPRLTATGPA